MYESTLPFEVSTSVHLSTGVIEQTVRVGEQVHQLEQDLVKHIMCTREQGVREALIKLGWTPPKEQS